MRLAHAAREDEPGGRPSARRRPSVHFVVTDPPYGGVSASFATLGDLLVSEPGSYIGFAGPKVIEQTVRQKLPDGFQTAGFLLEHGQLDLVEPRESLRVTLRKVLDLHAAP